MAARALRSLLVHLHPLAGGQSLARQPGDLRHVRRRGRWRVVEQLSQHPGAPLDGAGMLAVAAHRMNRRHAEQAAAGRIIRHGDLAELVAMHAFEAVVVGQQAVDDDVVGLEQVSDPTILPQQVRERLVDLAAGRGLRAVIELRIERAVELKEVEALHREPLRHERLDESR